MPKWRRDPCGLMITFLLGSLVECVHERIHPPRLVACLSSTQEFGEILLRITCFASENDLRLLNGLFVSTVEPLATMQ